MTELERNKELKETIFEAQNSVAEIKIFYEGLSKTPEQERCKNLEIDAVISGSKSRLLTLGISNEDIEKIDFYANDPTAKFIAWCNQNQLSPKDYKALQRYQKEVGISWN